MKKKMPELVAPAGDFGALKTAVKSGADSVYFGIKDINMRNFAVNFDVLEIKKIMEYLHENGVNGYLTLNTIIMNKELDKVKRVLEEAKKRKVDAVILWDMAVLSIAKELGLKIHLSTQASVSNAKALEFYSDLGVRRIVLARECTLNDIRRMIKYIKDHKLQCEIETFIHGAMCISVSGRCFMSQYIYGKSANKGECMQPCRREYFIKDVDEGIEYDLGKDYILSAKDLCCISFIDKLIENGIHAFKIEGRIRSPEYIKVVVSAYRRAIDTFFNGTLNDVYKKQLKQELATVYNRGFSDGFYFGPPEDAVSRELEHTHEKLFLGEVIKFYKNISVADIFVRNNSLSRGDTLLFVGKTTPASFAVANTLEVNHAPIEKVNRNQNVGVKLPFLVRRNDKVFLWRKKIFQ